MAIKTWIQKLVAEWGITWVTRRQKLEAKIVELEQRLRSQTKWYEDERRAHERELRQCHDLTRSLKDAAHEIEWHRGMGNRYRLVISIDADMFNRYFPDDYARATLATHIGHRVADDIARSLFIEAEPVKPRPTHFNKFAGS